MTNRPDPATLDVHELDRAEVELQRQYRVPSFRVARGEEPEGVPPDVLAWQRQADARRRRLIESTRGAPLYVTDDIEPMELRKDRLRKPGPLQLPNGTVVATSPTLTATVTNTDTGAHVDLKIPGPVRTTLATGEAVFLGPSLVIRSENFGDTTNGLVYVKGRFTFPPFSGVGTLTDICALLA